MSQWIPVPFNLLEGNPFEYSEHTISSISGTEAFETGIRTRDNHFCVVCGYDLQPSLNYCHIIPKSEDETWKEMKDAGFVPQTAKGVMHEARNAIRLCLTHHGVFDAYYYYIRWFPEEERFVFINHSQAKKLEDYHGKAINLGPSKDRLPFHGAFLFHEMRVRGYWPLREDRAIPLPIPWVDWLTTDDGDNKDGDDMNSDNGAGGGGDGDNGDSGGRGGHGGQVSRGERGGRGRGGNNGPVPGSSASGKVFIPSNPFKNPASLKALKESFAKQPNWKASVMEGTTWEGNADENAAKWRRLNRIES